MATKSRNKKLKEDIYKIIRNDIPLRQKIADALNIENNSVYMAALRKSAKFTLPFIVDVISKHTGKTKEQILEQ